MIKKNVVKAALIALTLFQAGTAGAQIIVNGDFEADPGAIGGSSGYLTVLAGQTTIGGWTVSGRSVDLVKNDYGAVTNYSVDLAGSPGPGGIEQTFATTAGMTYTVDFDYGTNGGGFPLRVLFGHFGAGVVPTISTFAVPAGVAHGQISFVSNGGLAKLALFTTSSGYAGPTVDNISVTAVPEPAAAAMLLLGLATIGVFRRKR